MKHASAIHAVPIKEIHVKDRHRRDMGDLAALAESIDRDGLLQPIGITEKNRLVFGERRLRAVRDVLKREKIEARIVRLESILTGEYVENELRKEFTPSERVDIAKAVKVELGERRGKDNQENIPEYKGQQTRDIAAQKAGFGNPKTYEQAQKVVDYGTAALTAAMDSGDLSISAASKVAAQPKAEQKRILSLPKPERKAVIKNLAPSPKKAREIALKTGKPVAASNNKYILPMSASDERKLGEEQNLVGNIYRAMQLLANPGITAKQLAELAPKHFCHDIHDLARDGAAFLMFLMDETKNGKTKRVG